MRDLLIVYIWVVSSLFIVFTLSCILGAYGIIH